MLRSKHKHIIFTGGGSAGHVTPNIALIEKLRAIETEKAAESWGISYIGSRRGIEHELITALGLGVDYFAIATGKLRRYFSWQNFIDPLKIFFGILQALWLCLRLKPSVIFSKGGFVSFPVVVAGWLLRIPIILHESDLTPGLANKLCYPFASKVCLTFPDSLRYFPTPGKLQNKVKVVVTGTPIRASLFNGSQDKGLKICGFTSDKKVVLVMGGSLGAERINQVVRLALPQLTQEAQIAHICGIDKIEAHLDSPNYKQFTYLHDDLAHLLAAATVVISRAGANSIYELLALKKPHILIPLTKRSSRGDQIDNALHFDQLGVSQVILEEDLTREVLIEKVRWILQQEKEISSKLQELQLQHSTNLICNIINSYTH